MEFPGVGVLPYEPPAEELRPFFRRKYKTFFKYVRELRTVQSHEHCAKNDNFCIVLCTGAHANVYVLCR